MSTAVRVSPTQQRKKLLELLPEPGQWSEEEYLWLTDRTRRLVEFTDGCLEFLPMPTDRHQSVLEFLYLLWQAFLPSRGGKVHLSGIRVQLRTGKFRVPDLLLVRDAKDPRRQDRFWTGADLVLEVVSKDDPARDLFRKRHDYAQAKIPEYWIVNPQTETILVYRLKGRKYPKAHVFARGTRAVSHLFPDFSVNVDDVFDVD
jgi:Uma2 family endonuclease